MLKEKLLQFLAGIQWLNFGDKQMDIELVKQFTQDHLKDEKTGHDYYHGQRVANLATKM